MNALFYSEIFIIKEFFKRRWTYDSITDAFDERRVEIFDFVLP